jgi:hypothetical protein
MIFKNFRIIEAATGFRSRIGARNAIRTSSWLIHAASIIQSRAAQFPVFQSEAKRFDQMQACAGIGAQAHDVAGIRRYFGLILKNDVEHVSVFRSAGSR